MPPSGPTTISSSPAPVGGSQEPSPAARQRFLVQHEGRRRPRRSAARPRPSSRSSAITGQRARRACLAASAAACSQRRAERSGTHDATQRCGRPGHDLVDPDLGQQLDGELGPVALDQRLHHDDARLRRGRRRRARRTSSSSRSRPALGDDALGQPALAVGQVDPLAGAQPAHRGRVTTLRTVEGQPVRRPAAGAAGRPVPSRRRTAGGHSPSGRRDACRTGARGCRWTRWRGRSR